MRVVLQPLVFLCLCLLPLAQSNCDPRDLSSWTPEDCITEPCSCYIGKSLNCDCSLSRIYYIFNSTTTLDEIELFFNFSFNIPMDIRSVHLVHCQDPICSPPLQALELAYHPEHTQSCEHKFSNGNFSLSSPNCTSIIISTVLSANGLSFFLAHYDTPDSLNGTHLVFTILPDTSEHVYQYFAVFTWIFVHSI